MGKSCPTCGGSGLNFTAIDLPIPCPECEGTGRTLAEREGVE